MTQSRRILGVDPGTNFLGYAVIQVKKDKIAIVKIGVVKMQHLESQALKLKKIFERLEEIIGSTDPEEMAIEAPFFGKNVQSMLKLGRAQGVAIAAGIINKLEVTEYSPKKIKQSITGSGNASKEQVAAMLENIIKVKLDEQTLDATDALATAVCHHFKSSSVLGGSKRYGGWANFIKENPDRAKG